MTSNIDGGLISYRTHQSYINETLETIKKRATSIIQMWQGEVKQACTNAFVFIADGFDDQFNEPDTPVEVDIVSDNVNDDGAPEGVGAQQVTIFGVDENTE